MKAIKVLLDDRNTKGRRLVEAELLEERATTLKVKLPDGHVITRKKKRDLPKQEEQS